MFLLSNLSGAEKEKWELDYGREEEVNFFEMVGKNRTSWSVCRQCMARLQIGEANLDIDFTSSFLYKSNLSVSAPVRVEHESEAVWRKVNWSCQTRCRLKSFPSLCPLLTSTCWRAEDQQDLWSGKIRLISSLSQKVMEWVWDSSSETALQTTDGPKDQTDNPKPFSGNVNICTAQTTSVNII